MGRDLKIILLSELQKGFITKKPKTLRLLSLQGTYTLGKGTYTLGKGTSTLGMSEWLMQDKMEQGDNWDYWNEIFL